MKTYVSYQFANYAHLYMYIAYTLFETKMREQRKIGRLDYVLDVDIDGNVVAWDFKTDDLGIEKYFNDAIAPRRYEKTIIENAVNLCSLSLEKTVSHLSCDELQKALSHGDMSSHKPAITDDSLIAPALAFEKTKNVENTEIVFECENMSGILDYYISAISQHLSYLLPQALVRAEPQNGKINIAHDSDLDIDLAKTIERLKIADFDKKVARVLGISQAEVDENLKKIYLHILKNRPRFSIIK